jgi:hypothetical protein
MKSNSCFSLLYMHVAYCARILPNKRLAERETGTEDLPTQLEREREHLRGNILLDERQEKKIQSSNRKENCCHKNCVLS